VFEGAAAVHVPRARFAPVKTASNLLVVRSDAYELADDWTIRLAPQRNAAPSVELSSEFKLLRDFEERFAAGPPSLVEAERLEVDGDVRFGAQVVIRGRVRVEGPASIPDGALLEGQLQR
jgi:UTP--glucose-1-phosphate uridylyltransferase